ncbi:SDR family NAD(P)-dependent oxidoreductase [Schumannella luteola]|uniref:Dihydroanticapsin dehydrogenase n=1 Tax=Schumannella luteola TaxID=472059 RepID=A0A852YDY3_9MICO|nr:SDR family NAD(P)-dependent oxidoreductase [Schumannella luteola]NYH00734.1 dihydroanticapsin dehydrogenase [Schumannella luteola]TPX03947.1 SDR family oxidoreductase [Schumannella luteola]
MSAALAPRGPRMDGRRVVITGAAANIGAATARLLGAEGASVVIGDLDDRAQLVVDELVDAGVTATFVKTDVSNGESMQALLAAANEFLGGIDVIINNAGVQRSSAISEMSESDWDLHMNVNARSCFLAARYGVPYLRESGRNPAIVNMASVGGYKAPAGLSGYSASKGAIIAFTRTVATELGPDGIRVNAIAPGWVDTSFNDPIVAHMGGKAVQDAQVAAGVPLGRQGRSDEIAEAFLFLASDASTFMTGQTIVIDGGAS